MASGDIIMSRKEAINQRIEEFIRNPLWETHSPTTAIPAMAP
jgi:hypothetical protein